MSMSKVSSFWLRHAEKDITNPITGQITGRIPEWLHGVLYRNGCGIKHIGPDKYNHLFDGLAIVHKFTVRDGSATYQSRFLESDIYRKNMAAGRIEEGTFGTLGREDLCRNFFGRLMSTFRDLSGGRKRATGADNCCVTVGYVGQRLYTMTETAKVWQINEDDLSAEKQINLSNVVSVDSATAHPHVAPDGTVYNVGSSFAGAGGPQVTFVAFPAEGNGESGQLVGRLPHRWPLEPSYFHSFGITDRFLVFVQQPLVISVRKMMFLKLKKQPLTAAISVKRGEKTWIRLLDKTTGEVHKITYEADAFFAFHHVNAYEQDGYVVVDVCCFEPGELSMMEMGDLKLMASGGEGQAVPMLRFVLPLEPASQPPGANLVTLAGAQASATLCGDNAVHCTPQRLSPPELRTVDLPRINYAFNGKPYRYAYACHFVGAAGNAQSLVKIDVQTGAVATWSDAEWSPSEPVFVAQPGAAAEDAGVLLASLLHVTEPRRCALLVLDAASMHELGRAEFATDATVPKDFHGLFASAGDQIHTF